jgi:RNA polymerase sigma factor (sigma-70 family)
MDNLIGLIRRGKIHCKFLQNDGQLVSIDTKIVERNLFLRTMRRIRPNEIPQVLAQSIALPPTIPVEPIIQDSKPKEVFFEKMEATKQVVEKFIKEYQATKNEVSRNKAMHYLVGYYDKRLEATIKKMSFNANPEKVEDFKEDFYCRVIDQDVLGKFDKTKSQLTTLLWKVTNTVVVNSYHKHKKMESATSYMSEAVSVGSKTEIQDFIPSDRNDYDDIESSEIEDKFEDFLLYTKKKNPTSVQIFRMMANGYKVKEIAQEIGISNTLTSTFCKEIKKSLLEFYQNQDLCLPAVSKLKKANNL